MNRRFRRGFAAFKLTASVCVVPMGSHKTVEAFEGSAWGPPCGNAGTLYFWFDDTGPGGAWTVSRKTAMLSGLNSLTVYKQNSGAQAMATIDQTSTPPASRNPNAFRIYQDFTTPAAATSCGATPRHITVNPAELSLSYIGQHEGLHALGLDHTSRYENLTSSGGVVDSGSAPVMSGCFRGNLDVDDYAAISFNRAGLRSVNGGFENGGLTSVSSWYTIGTISKITSGQQSGAYSAEMDNGAGCNNAFVSSTRPLQSHLGLDTKQMERRRARSRGDSGRCHSLGRHAAPESSRRA